MVSGLPGVAIFLGAAASVGALADFRHSDSPQLMRIAEYADRPSRVVDPADDLRFNLVGELYRLRVINSGRTGEITIGSAVLVGPCTVASVFHVVAGADVRPRPDKVYTMTFSLSRGSGDQGFAGSTLATAVRWKETQQGDGIVLLQLQRCAGGLADAGWLPITTQSAAELGSSHMEVRSLGYSDLDRRCNLHMGSGVIEGYRTIASASHWGPDFALNEIEHSASADSHTSGGAIIGTEDNRVVLVAFAQGDEDVSGQGPGTLRFPKWSKGKSGYAIPASELRNWPEGMALIEDDIARFGKPNPAEMRLRKPLPAMPSAGDSTRSVSAT